MSSHPFAELICAYLDGEPGAVDVLNDALEETGRARLVVDGGPGERLALVLEHLLADALAKRVSLDFAKHVVHLCDSPLAEAMLAKKETDIDPGATAEQRRQATESLAELEGEPRFSRHSSPMALGWQGEAGPLSSAAWAAWGALMIPARYVAEAAQRINTTELQWQINHLKQLLSS